MGALDTDTSVHLIKQFDIGELAHTQESPTVFHPSPGAGDRSMDSVSTGEPGRLTSIEWGGPELRRRIGDRENGAKLRNYLERDAPDRLDLVTAKIVQPPL